MSTIMEEDSVNLDLTQDQQETRNSHPFMVGFVIAKIISFRNYYRSVCGNGKLAAIRDALCPADPYAIKVFSAQNLQVGRVERFVACILSPLMDQRMITIDCILPYIPNRDLHEIPSQIRIFTSPDALLTILTALSRLNFFFYPNCDQKVVLLDSAFVEERNSKEETITADKIFPPVDMDEYRRDWLNILVPPENIIKTNLYIHQKKGLWELINRENSNELTCFWREDDIACMNNLMKCKNVEQPVPLRGGIFVDNMGSGKTLTMLSLITTNKANFLCTSDPIADGNVGNRVAEEKVNSSRSLKKCKMVESGETMDRMGKSKAAECKTPTALHSQTTLIVCPPSGIVKWKRQIKEHTMPGQLNHHLFYRIRTINAEDLLKFDVVLTTYVTIGQESQSDSPIRKIQWFRVILDEVDIVKILDDGQREAVISLKAKRRWAVTGAPNQIDLPCLFFLMNFLKILPFSVKRPWVHLVQHPVDIRDENGLLRLQVLLGTISLRITKEMLLDALPTKTFETCYVWLSPKECVIYEKIESEARMAAWRYINANKIMRNYTIVLHNILQLRQICDGATLCPSDISFLPSSSRKDESKDPKLVSTLQNGCDFECPICLNPPAITVITVCLHIFCEDCILRVLKTRTPVCPLCQDPLSQSRYKFLPVIPKDDGPINISYSERTTSSKVSTLLRLMEASKEECTSTKSVVFSLFKNILILLEEALEESGFKVRRLDDSMIAEKRERMVKEFRESSMGVPTVLLASLSVARLGINLTAASRVYLLEPWWNAALEEQAVEQVWRIGQREQVKVVRIIARNSIEERVLQFREMKKMREAHGKKSYKEHKMMLIHDLRIVMGL